METTKAGELPARLVAPTEVEGSAETIEFNVEAIREALGAKDPAARRHGVVTPP